MPSLSSLPSSRFAARRTPSVCRSVILSVHASSRHRGLCRPLQLYFVLNEWVIRRPVVLRAPTGRGPCRERTVGRLKADAHTGALWPSFVRRCVVSGGKNKNKMGSRKTQSVISLLALLALLLVLLVILWLCGSLSQEGLFFFVRVFDWPYGGHMSRRAAMSFPQQLVF